MSSRRQVFFDTETTGFEPANGDRMVEIALMEVIDRKKTGKTLHLFMDPEMEVPEGAFKIHGWNRENLIIKSGNKKFADIDEQIYDFIIGDYNPKIDGDDKKTEIVAHNADFDIKFLDSEFNKSGLFERKGIEKIQDICLKRDTLAIARGIFGAGRVNLDSLCVKYDIKNDKRDLHGALIDTELLLQVYLRMTQNQSTLDFDGSHSDKKSKVSASRMSINTEEIPKELSDQLPSLKITEASLANNDKMSEKIKKASGEEFSMF
jgi:DNA polymerase-3 subunit epsilon